MVRVTLVPVSYLFAPSAVHSYRVPGKFIRLVRIKQKFIRIAYLYSKCTDCRINGCICTHCCISHNDHGMQNTNKTTVIDSLSGFRQLFSDIHLYPNYFFIKRPLLFCSEMGSMHPSSGDDRWVMSCVHFCSEMGSMLPSNGDDHWVMSSVRSNQEP